MKQVFAFWHAVSAKKCFFSAPLPSSLLFSILTLAFLFWIFLLSKLNVAVVAVHLFISDVLMPTILLCLSGELYI